LRRMSAEWTAGVTGGTVVRSGPAALGAEVDTRRLRKGALFAALAGTRRDGHDFLGEAAGRGAAGLLVAREKLAGLDLPQGPFVVAVEDPVEALALLARAWRRLFPVPSAAVTGSFGKSTTKEILAALLGGRRGGVTASPASFNNHIGVPLTLLAMGEETKFLVTEIGSNAPGEVASLAELAAPRVGIVTGVGPVHLEGLGDEEGVAREKGALLEALPEEGTAVLDRESPWFGFLAERSPCRVLSAALEDRAAEIRPDGVEIGPSSVKIRWKGIDFSLPLPGRHNAKNLLLALGAFLSLGGEPEEGARNLESFTPVPGRLSLRILPSGVRVLDDSYNSNLPAASAALDVLSSTACRGRRIALLGEMLESGGRAGELHRELGRRAAGAADLLFFVGGSPVEAACRGALERGIPEEKVRRFPSAEEAGEALAELVRPGDLVLLKGSRGIGLERVLRFLEEGKEGGRAV